MFHLVTHAFFKALLFLGSGAVIHALAGEQDLRNMGGLKRYLPITYWTFLIGTLAIAGLPLFSGFFSKDEILFRAYASGHTVLWAIGVLTALLTATYMFRVVFLTFHGERRHDAPAAPAHPEEEEPAAQAAHTGHGGGHAHTPHEAPWSMAIPLILLAIGSVVAGYVGVPHVLGGSNRIEAFLEPSFVAHPAEGTVPAAGVMETTAAGATPATQEPGGEAAHEPAVPASTELTLMAISIGAAFAGIVIAFYFWLRNRDAAARAAERFAGLYRLLLNKYYVDQIYDAAIVQPIKALSTVVLWRGIDAGVIDGAVNGIGSAVRGGSGVLRRLQTGSIRVYAASLFLGAALIVGYYLWS
jgi:NADH-quinone oxidoreductase subunit L